MLRDALVVGVNTYQNLAGLRAPARDAEAVAKTLQTYGEFRVHRLPEVIQAGQAQVGQKTQVTLQMLESALVQLFKPKGRSTAQTALFYFSGHGLQREAGIREGFLAPSNADPDRGFYGLSLFWLRRLLQESPVRQRIVILDCCHSGELLNFLEADPGAAPGTDRLFMAASREYETAYESIESPYSVFTRALLTGLDPQRSPTGIVNHHALTEWVNHQLKGEIQQPLFESSGSEIILTRQITRIEQVTRIASAPVGTARHPSATELPQLNVQLQPDENPVCPYPGLEAFDEMHAEYFFGRESLTVELLQKLKADRLVAVVGASGVGKSSLVRAGLLPLLRQTRQKQRQARQYQTYADWQIKLLTPGEHPLESLASAFVDPEAAAIDRAEQLGRAEQLLQSGTAGFVQLVRGSLSQHFSSTGLQPKTRSQMLLVIDQFEEVFTRQAQTNWQRQQFLACLTAALQDLSDCLKIIIVLRSDFWEDCRQWEPLASRIAQHSVVVPPLTCEQLKAAIVRPAQKAGLRCEPNLVYTLLLDLMGAPGELALLQSTLLELWNHRKTSSEGANCLTLESYHQLGGIRQLLSKRATEQFHRFSAAEQAIAQRIFLSLTQFGEGTEDTRRRVLKSQLISPAYAPDKAVLVESILEKLIAARLLVMGQAGLDIAESARAESSRQHACLLSDAPSTDSKAAYLPDWGNPAGDTPHSCSQTQPLEKTAQGIVDVAHESLIRHWELLRQWCDRDRETLRRQRGLEEAAQAWYAAEQPSSIEFLLTGYRLQDAEKLAFDYAQDLSALVQEYVLASRREAQRMQRESRQLRIAVPACLMATLAVMLGQSLSVIQAQTEQEQQLQIATARERAAITQTILQEAANPTTAILMGRLAAQGGPSEVAQASLRQSLQSLRLQLELPIIQGGDVQGGDVQGANVQGGIQQLQASPDGRRLAVNASGKIHLWFLQPNTLYSRTSPPQSGQILDWTIGSTAPVKGLRIAGIQFSPDGESIAAFAESQPDIKVWAAQYGALLLHLKGSAPVTQIRFSSSGEWLASVHADRSLAIWRTDTGQLQTRLLLPQPIDQVQFTPDGYLLLSVNNSVNNGVNNYPQRYRLVQAENQPLQLQPVAPLHRSLVHRTLANPTSAHPAQGKAVSAESIKQTVFSPQSQWTATLSETGQIGIWRSQTGQLVDRFSVSQAVKMQFSPDNQRLSILTGSQVLLYHLPTQRLTRIALADAHFDRATELPGTQSALTFSADGRWIATRSWKMIGRRQQQIIQVWDGRSGKPVGMPLQNDSVTDLRFSPDNAYLITGDAEGRLQFWSVQTGGELPTLEQAGAQIRWTAFLRHNLHDEQNGEQNQAGQAQGVQDKTVQLMTIAENGQFQLWSLPVPAVPAAPLSPYRIPSTSIHTVALQPQNFWQKLTGFVAQQNPFAASDSPFRRREKPPGGIGTGKPWTAELQTEQAVPSSRSTPALTTSNKPFASVAFSGDGQWLAAADANGTIALHQRQPDRTYRLQYQIQNLRSRNPLAPKSTLSSTIAAQAGSATRLTHPPGNVSIRQLRFSPDGKYLLGVGEDWTVRLWWVESGEMIRVWRSHRAAIHQARFSADGLHIITASQDRTAQVLEVELDAKPGQSEQVSAQPISTQPISTQPVIVLHHSTAVTSSSFSPDDRQIATGREDGKISLYDRASGQLELVLAGHLGAITDIQYSPDGESIVTASTDGTAILWNARTGEQRAVLKPAQRSTLQPLLQATFSPDGQYVTMLTQNGQVQIWAATWEHLLTLAQERTTRQLTAEECSRYLNLSSDQCPQLSIPQLSLQE